MNTLNFICSLIVLLSACSTQNIDKDIDKETGQETEQEMEDINEGFADVTNVSISGNEGSYSFAVTLSSPDTGCDQYADWWEVLSENGELIYRRILGHSHVNEQPFTRSGNVNITEDQTVWIRAHMNNTSYGGKNFKGSIISGFSEEQMPENFALVVEKESPLPDGCAF